MFSLDAARALGLFLTFCCERAAAPSEGCSETPLHLHKIAAGETTFRDLNRESRQAVRKRCERAS
jgi:hypothetical protein